MEPVDSGDDIKRFRPLVVSPPPTTQLKSRTDKPNTSIEMAVASIHGPAQQEPPAGIVATETTATARPTGSMLESIVVEPATVTQKIAIPMIAENAAPSPVIPRPVVASPPQQAIQQTTVPQPPPLAAETPDETVALKWPFIMADQTEQLPTPPPATSLSMPVSSNDVTLNVDGVDVRTVLEMLAKEYGMNLLVAPDVNGIVTANVSGLSPEQTLRSIVCMCDLATQREDNVILVYPRDNHQGLIIGGLIQESDRVIIKKLPWVGDFKYVGKLFQRRETTRFRSEVIITLIPNLIEPNQAGNFSPNDPCKNQADWERTDSRLFNGPLNRECRPWEARLPGVTGETVIHRDIDRQRNRYPYEKGCEPIKSGLLHH